MKLLVDKELVTLVMCNKIIENLEQPADWYEKKSPIQPSSIDIHIGKIFVPEVDPDRRGGLNNPKSDYHTLHAGETALVETAEKLNVPSNIAGFGFPPASTAVKGILMTNPGHIDPGFIGKLTFTLINMGKDPFTIRQGDILFTTLWVQLSCNVKKDLNSRNGPKVTSAIEANLDVLSKDFLDVDNRAALEAKKTAKSYIIWASILAASISALVGGLQYAVNNSTNINKRIEEMSKSIAVLGVKIEQNDSKQIAGLEKTVNSLQRKIELIEKQRDSKSNQ